MERKTKIEIGLGIAVILLFIAFFIYWKRQVLPTPVVVSNPVSAIETSKDKATKTSTLSEAKDAVAPAVVLSNETSAITVARTFVERLGSYSSEADAANIEDIMPMATSSFQRKLEVLVKDIRSSTSSKYYSVSTLVVTAPKTMSASATDTVLTMTTQRIESKEDPGNTTKKYQSITVALVKFGTTWLVDGYTWKDGV